MISKEQAEREATEKAAAEEREKAAKEVDAARQKTERSLHRAVRLTSAKSSTVQLL